MQYAMPKTSVDKSSWRSCKSCKALIPVIRDKYVSETGTIKYLETHTYVCPFCSHSHVGTPLNTSDILTQKTCHKCNTELGDPYRCPKCDCPRGWKIVECRYCGNMQPVFAPHWVVHCPTCELNCVNCESLVLSLCIC